MPFLMFMESPIYPEDSDCGGSRATAYLLQKVCMGQHCLDGEAFPEQLERSLHKLLVGLALQLCKA